MTQIVSAVLMALLLAGCVSRPLPVMAIGAACTPDACRPLLNDLDTFPQNIAPYLDAAPDTPMIMEEQRHYKASYYSVWDANYTLPPRDDVTWPFRSYRSDNAYGANLQPLPQAWFDRMYALSDWEAYGSVDRCAVALVDLDLRNFPTEQPLFHDPLQAGEGFPFDYLQNSSVFAAEPLRISHLSRDGAWAYVLTSYATGWVPFRQIAFLPAPMREALRQAPLAALMHDDTPLYTRQGRYLFRGRVGMVLPYTDANATAYRTSVGGGTPDIIAVPVPKTAAEPLPLPMTRGNLERVIDGVMQSKYGWGGLYGERDCSSTIRDIFAPFGIWLPRNSYRQSQVGRVYAFEGMSDQEKLEAIARDGVPFRTLLYLKGHILLYLGLYDGVPVALHNTWGVKTESGERTGRYLVGGVVITSLQPGKELEGFRTENAILSKLVSMNVVIEAFETAPDLYQARRGD